MFIYYRCAQLVVAPNSSENFSPYIQLVINYQSPLLRYEISEEDISIARNNGLISKALKYGSFTKFHTFIHKPKQSYNALADVVQRPQQTRDYESFHIL